MSKRSIVIILLGTGLLCLTWFGFFWIVQPVSAIGLNPIIAHITPLPMGAIMDADPILPTITPTTIAAPLVKTAPQSNGLSSVNWFDVAIIAAFIGLVGVIINPFITQWVAGKADRKKERRAEQAQKVKDAQEASNAQKRQQEEEQKRIAAEEARKNMLEGYVKRYRERLRQDDTVASIKILGMTRPVEVVNVYVQLKLRQDIRANATGMLDAIRDERDPNVILQVVRKRMEENYARQAIDPVKALRDNQQCVLLGDPGSGKTTLLKYLTVQTLDKSTQVSGLPNLPVFVELSKFAEAKCGNLEEFIAQRWDSRYGFPQENARAYIDQQLEAGNVLLLLDGLDEAASGKNKDEQDESYRRTSEAITRIVTRYPDVYIIVTARIAGYRQHTSLAAFTELEMLDFRTEDIQEFVNRWFAGTNTQRVQKGKDLNAQLAHNIRIQTLAANPLLLSLIVILYERRERLPERRADLYRQCIDMLLDEWDRRQKNLQRNIVLSVEKKRDLLQRVAWYFHNRQERYFPDDRLLKEIERILPGLGLRTEQAEQVLEEISADTGLLKEQAESWYGFLHLTFQEYFVARYMVRNGLLDELLAHRGEPWWEEVILLYAGSTDDLKPLIEKLLELDDDIFVTNVMLAGKCFAASSALEHDCETLQRQVIKQLFEILHTTPYELNRANAADTLAELGRVEETINTRFLEILVDKNANSELVQAIVLALSTYGKHSLVDTLLELFLNPTIHHTDEDSLASILHNLAHSDVIPILIQNLLDKTTTILIRRNIITILEAVGDHTLSATLLPYLLDPQEDYRLRLNIAFAWEKLGDPLSIKNLLVQVADPKVNNDSLTVLVIALSFFDDPMITPVFLQLLQSLNQELSLSSLLIALLRDANSKTVTDVLINIINNHQIDRYYRRELVETLRSVDSEKKTVSIMQNLYADPALEPDLKQEIALSLYVLGNKNITIDTQKILEEAYMFGDVEQAIIKRMPVAAQLKMLANPNILPLVRSGIAEGLSIMRDTSIVPQLHLLAANRKLHLDVRKAIIETLQRIADDKTTVETLIDLMNSDPQVQNVAEHALWYVSRRAGVRIMENEMTKRIIIG